MTASSPTPDQRLDALRRRLHAAIDLRCAIERECSRSTFLALRCHFWARWFDAVRDTVAAFRLLRHHYRPHR